jgi:hypothetical protein
MFLVFKLSFVVDILALFDLVTLGYSLKKLANFFSNCLVTLSCTYLAPCAVQQQILHSFCASLSIPFNSAFIQYGPQFNNI